MLQHTLQHHYTCTVRRATAAAVGSVWSCLVWIGGSEIQLILLCLELDFSQETTRSSASIFFQIRLWKTCPVVEFYFSKLHSLYPKRSCLIVKLRHSKACWASLIYFLYIWFDKPTPWCFAFAIELLFVRFHIGIRADFSSEFINV